MPADQLLRLSLSVGFATALGVAAASFVACDLDTAASDDDDDASSDDDDTPSWPEAQCLAAPPDQCDDPDDPCQPQQGYKLATDCTRSEQAFCRAQPGDGSTAPMIARDPDGNCWQFSTIFALPVDWKQLHNASGWSLDLREDCGIEIANPPPCDARPTSADCNTRDIETCTEKPGCSVAVGSRYNPDRNCTEPNQPAYCMPHVGDCPGMPFAALAPNGDCFEFNCLLRVPDDWQAGRDGASMSGICPSWQDGGETPCAP